MSKYRLGIAELDKVLGEIEGGSNIMLIGPPMCRKDALVYNILYAGLLSGESGILVTTEEMGGSVLKQFKQDELDTSMERLGIVDCVSISLGIRVSDTENIKMVPNPMDLTGIGVKISQFFEQFHVRNRIQRTRLIVNSLSTMLMYSNLQTVFRFLHVFTGRIKAADALGIYVLEAGMHDDSVIATLKQLFDGVIEIGEEGDQFFIRAKMGARPTEWIGYDIDRTKNVTQLKGGVSRVINR
ncbi:MAG: RAD55 family ATPase [Methanocellales archaeon]|nr:RAD55 family ATPase [Methanocellales archaeon]